MCFRLMTNNTEQNNSDQKSAGEHQLLEGQVDSGGEGRKPG
jgi:hypothetical protein